MRSMLPSASIFWSIAKSSPVSVLSCSRISAARPDALSSEPSGDIFKTISLLPKAIAGISAVLNSVGVICDATRIFAFLSSSFGKPIFQRRSRTASRALSSSSSCVRRIILQIRTVSSTIWRVARAPILSNSEFTISLMSLFIISTRSPMTITGSAESPTEKAASVFFSGIFIFAQRLLPPRF